MKKSILLIGSSLLFIAAYAQGELEIVNQTLSRNDFKAHIEFLASDELRGRDTGSPEIDIAAKYLASRLSSYGAQSVNGSYYQEVKLENNVSPSTLTFNLNGELDDNLIMLRGINISSQADAIYLNFGSEEDFAKKDVTGKIVVVKAGTADGFAIRSAFGASREKRKLAKEKGAIGLVELAPIESQMWGRLKIYFSSDKIGLASEDDESFTHLWMMDAQNAKAETLKVGKKMKSELVISGMKNRPISGRNVVGIIEGSDPKLKNEYVVYSAHYDHLGVGRADANGDSIYNGARDNAVGTVTVLSVAKNLGKFPTKRSALFIFFTGEEKGLLGSTWFAEHSPIPMEQIVYCFNSDNAAYNDTTIASIFGIDRTTAKALIVDGVEASGLKAMGDVSPEQNIYNRSDHVNFAKKGVPSVMFSVGISAFDEDISHTYHQANDHAETLDYDYLEKFFRAYVLTSRLIANADETPFWVEGEQYYEAGVKLYKK